MKKQLPAFLVLLLITLIAGLVLGGDDGRTVVEVRDHEITVVHIPDGVIKIGKGAFSRCSRLLTVTIPDTVTNIGDFAFFQCIGLNKLVIPDSVTQIGDYAFYKADLTAIRMPAGITSIGKYAFRDCNGLTDITIQIIIYIRR